MTITRVAIACQGGGSHAAFTAGVLQALCTEDRQRGGIRIVGLSGTSGGAMCAALAWHGLLEGGPAAVQKRLQAFWDENAVQPCDPYEAWFNSVAVQASRLPFELRQSPYMPPQIWNEFIFDNLWFSRRAFTSLPTLIEHHVPRQMLDDARQVTKLHRLAADIRAAAAEETLVRAGCLPGPAGDRTALLAEALDVLCGKGLHKLYWFEQWLKARSLKAENLTESEFLELAADLPALFIGAADAVNGSFRAFASRTEYLQREMLLATAALPWLFRAVTVPNDKQGDRHAAYWDGLFSQNPPISNFLSGAVEAEKPDEIWIVQINPQGRDGKPMLPSDIVDRRNELSGNLSLNQEAGYIAAVNRWIALDGLDGRHKPVRVHRICLDDAEFGGLDLASKVDRDGDYLNHLIRHGREQAEAFLERRSRLDLVYRFFEEVWNEPSAAKRKTALNALWPQAQATSPLLAHINAGHAHLQGYRVTLPEMRMDGAWVQAGWRARAVEGNVRVDFSGTVRFKLGDGRLLDAELAEVKAVQTSPAIDAGSDEKVA